jgi:hypothetical protein
MIMEDICSDVLNSVALLPSSQSPLVVMAFAVQSELVISGGMWIHAIQLHTETQNIVFRVSAFFLVSDWITYSILLVDDTINITCSLSPIPTNSSDQ